MKKRVGKVLEADDLQAAANGAQQWSRRLRELRAEGWLISSHNDRVDLKPGQYVLEADAPTAGKHTLERPISAATRAKVFHDDGAFCCFCGVVPGDPDESRPGRTVKLQIGHIIDRNHGGSDDPDNLRVECSSCNEGAKNMAAEPPSYSWLWSRVRLAGKADQRAILGKLKEKFKESRVF